MTNGSERPMNVLIVDADAPEAFIVARCLAASGAVALYGVGEAIGPVQKYGGSFKAVRDVGVAGESEAWLSAVHDAIEGWRIDVLLPISVRGLRRLAECKARGALAQVAAPPSPPALAIEAVADKWRFGEFLRAQGLPHPESFLPGRDGPSVLSALRPPLLIKPARSRGGVGIERSLDATQAAARLAERDDAVDAVVQSEIDGADYGVNVLCRDGIVLAATVQKTIKSSSAPFEFALGVEFVDEPELLQIAAKLIGALRWSGVANMDVRREATTGRFLILEFNARYWGSLLGSLSAGVNFPLLACRLALDERVEATQAHNVRYFRGPGPVVAALTGGGDMRIRIGETDWRYYRGDWRGVSVWLAVSLWRSIVGLFGRNMSSPRELSP